MPRGDQTGPHGLGPLTGRGLGLCRSRNDPTPSNRQNMNWGRRLLSNITGAFRMGNGGGIGRGRGMGRRGGFGQNR